MSKFRLIFPALALALAVTSQASAQAESSQCFPTCDITDSRMLSLGGAGLRTNAGFELLLKLEVPAGKKSFRLGIFDGDTGKDKFDIVDPNNDGMRGHWDEGPRSPSNAQSVQLTFELWADRQGNGLGFLDIENLVAKWTGNDDNPNPEDLSWESDCIVDGVFYSFCPSMPDNAWWNATVKTDDRAESNDGKFVYLLRVVNPSPSAVFSSNFKLRIASGSISVRQGRRLDANNPSLVQETAWGIQAAVRNVFGSMRIIYPEWDGTFPPSVPNNFFLVTPTTYDGKWEFPFNVNRGEDTIRILDGDFDFGTKLLTTVFSGDALTPCLDDDDPNYEGKPDFAGEATNDESAVVLGGEPADDTHLDPFLRRPCVVYELEDPLGNVYLNANPSSEKEWENFVVTAKPLVPAEHDYGGVANDPNQPPGFLPAGKWILRIRGLDVGNTVFLNGPNISGQPGASIGDRVWHDFDADGIQDPGELGINGVKVQLYDDKGNLVAQQTTSGDGGYLFTGLPGGNYSVQLTIDNFNSGQPLAGSTQTFDRDGNRDRFTSVALPVGGQILDADFGFVWPCAPCEGKVRELTLRYLGSVNNAMISVRLHKQNQVFVATVQPGQEFKLDAAVGLDKQGTLGPDVDLFVNGVFNTSIHTSCSQPIGPGLVRGDFVVVEGFSRQNGRLCPIGGGGGGNGPTPQCGKCDGKVTELTLQYLGLVSNATVSVVQKANGKEVFRGTVSPGGTFSFIGNDKHGTLGTDIDIFVDAKFNTQIHTSCSQPIGPGLKRGDFLVVAGASRFGGLLCPLNP